MSKKKKGYERRQEVLAADAVVCPFCGRPSVSKEYCTRCYAKFNKQVLSIAYTVENDPRDDRIGPFSSKTAKRLAWALLGVLIVVFIAATELSGAGFSSLGK